MSELEHLVDRGRSIPVALEQLSDLEAWLNPVTAWRDRAVEIFFGGKKSASSLLSVSWCLQ